MKKLFIITGVMLFSVSALAFQFIGSGGGGKRYNNTINKMEIKGAVWSSLANYSATTTRTHSVSYNGNTWIALANNTNQEPIDGSAYWAKFIAKGDTGPQGPAGATGSVASASSLNITQRQYSSGIIQLMQKGSVGTNTAVITVDDNLTTNPVMKITDAGITHNGTLIGSGGSGLTQSADDNNKADGTSWINTTAEQLVTRVGNRILAVALTLKNTLAAIFGLDSASTDHGSVTVGQESSHIARTLSNTGPVSGNVTFAGFSSNFRLVGFNNTSTATTGGATVTGAATATLPASSSITFKTAFKPTAAVTSNDHITVAGLVLGLTGVGIIADGPNVWYYSNGTDNYTNGTASDGTTTVRSSDILIAATGSLTKLSYKNYGGTVGESKLAIYTTSGTLLSSGCTASGSGYNAWVDCTLGTPYAVTAGSTIRVAWQSADSNTTIQYISGASGDGFYSSAGAYGSFPAGSLTYNSTTQKYAVRAYVD